jgi:ribosomal protein S18 acetylase RimI-like enzyme
MIVRPAVRSDLVGIGRVAEAAYWESYDGLLRVDTIGRLLSRDFGPSRLGRRLLRGGLRVVALDREVVAFCDGVLRDGAVQVDAIAVAPGSRRRGAGTALLMTLGDSDPTAAMTADVLLGNLEGEGFYEANGFVPGEIVSSRLFDEDIVERRWWCESEVGMLPGRAATAGG